MSITAWFLMVSILLNAAFVLGVPITLFVRFLIRRTQWRIIGQGSAGVDIRFGKPRGRYYTWKGRGGNNALVCIQQDLLSTDAEGRPVLWVDTDAMQQISPQRLDKLEDLPEDLRKVAGELAQLPGYRGRAVNDDAATTITGLDGAPKKLKYIVWQRISGSRLYKAFRDIRIQQMNDTNAGMWATIERLTPLLGLVAIVMLIIIMVQLGNLGSAGGA